MTTIRVADKLSLGILLGATTGSVLLGYSKLHAIKNTPVAYNPWMNLYYGVLGAAGVYQLIRFIAPKTKQEQQAEKIQQAYQSAITYRDRAKQQYLQTQSFLQQNLAKLQRSDAIKLPKK